MRKLGLSKFYPSHSSFSVRAINVAREGVYTHAGVSLGPTAEARVIISSGGCFITGQTIRLHHRASPTLIHSELHRNEKH